MSVQELTLFTIEVATVSFISNQFKAELAPGLG